MNGDPLELLTTDDIVREHWWRWNRDTVRRYFNRGIFFTHEKQGRVQLTYRGSAYTRYMALCKATRNIDISLQNAGRAFNKINGFHPDDEYILTKIREGQAVDELVSDVSNKLSDLLTGKQPQEN